jgi:CCR4-NOT transcription complex subunit 2
MLKLSWSRTGTVSQSQSSVPITTSSTAAPPFSSNGVNASEAHAHSSIPNPSGSSNPMATTNNNNATLLQKASVPQSQHPQTPAQQVLISAADRWGLLSLIAYMRNASTDVDHGLTSVGTDLGTMGLDMAYSG